MSKEKFTSGILLEIGRGAYLRLLHRTARHFSGGDGGGDTSGGGGFSAEEGDTETDDTDNHDMKLTNIAR